MFELPELFLFQRKEEPSRKYIAKQSGSDGAYYITGYGDYDLSELVGNGKGSMYLYFTFDFLKSGFLDGVITYSHGYKWRELDAFLIENRADKFTRYEEHGGLYAREMSYSEICEKNKGGV